MAFDDLDVNDEDEVIDASSKRGNLSPWLIGWVAFCTLIIFTLMCGVVYVLFFLPKQQADRLNILTTQRSLLQEQVGGLLKLKTQTLETETAVYQNDASSKLATAPEPTQRVNLIATLELFVTQTSEASRFNQNPTQTAEIEVVIPNTIESITLTLPPTATAIEPANTPTAQPPLETVTPTPTPQLPTSTATLPPTAQPPTDTVTPTNPPSATPLPTPKKRSGGVRVIEITLAPAMQTEVAAARQTAVVATQNAATLSAPVEPSPTETANPTETNEASPTSSPTKEALLPTATQTATAMATIAPTTTESPATQTPARESTVEILTPTSTAASIIALESIVPSPTQKPATQQTNITRLSRTGFIEIVLIPTLVVFALMVILVVILIRRKNHPN